MGNEKLIFSNEAAKLYFEDEQELLIFQDESKKLIFDEIQEIGAWTPADLGSKLINWWDGTIVDETPATEVDSWVDQKGTFDWQNIGATKKPEYDSVNNLIIFDASNLERLSNDANAASFNRSNGEYWFVVDYVLGEGIATVTTSDSTVSTKYFILQVIGDVIRISTRDGGLAHVIAGTTTLSSGKNIMRIKSTGSRYVVNLNNVDISSEFAAGNGNWESFITPNTVSMAALIRQVLFYSNDRIHAVWRCDENMTATDVTNTYNYLNAKY